MRNTIRQCRRQNRNAMNMMSSILEVNNTHNFDIWAQLKGLTELDQYRLIWETFQNLTDMDNILRI